MRQLFGTDGIRGVANTEPMTAETALHLGMALGAAASAQGREQVVVGRDTRLSGDLFESALVAGLLTAGARARPVGVLPTPAIALLTREIGAAYGIVISASHNRFEDNGLKVFGPDGFKLSDEEETALEMAMEAARRHPPRAAAAAIGRISPVMDAEERYLDHLRRGLPERFEVSDLRLVLDCAHGACHRVAPQLLTSLGAHVATLGVAPDGCNINADCGSLHPEPLQNRVRQTNAHVGLAFDGDGDRLIVVDEQGLVVDGDHLMAICARHLAAQGRLAHRTVVATVMSNLGLEVALEGLGIRLVRTAVGDRYVLERMRSDGYNFGGEQSGHLILLDRGTTGDGLLSALLLLEVLVATRQPLSQLRCVMTSYPQTLVNLQVREKPDLATLPSVQTAIEQAQAALGRQGRVLVRYSGTENKVRVMLEGADAEQIRSYAERIVHALRQTIGDGFEVA